MHYTGRKGWQANYRDTFGLNHTLNPIILAGLRKFKEVVTSSDTCAGIPGVIITEVYPDVEMHEVEDTSEAYEVWYNILDKMIYAFDESNEPDITKYDFNINIIESEPNEYGHIPCKFETVGKEGEAQRYDADLKEWDKKKREGQELFAKYYDCLWW